MATAEIRSLFVDRLFPLGQVVLTAGVNERVATDESFAKIVTQSIRRHAAGDWGNVDADDVGLNAQALSEGSRLFSVYGDGEGKIWIITEADRSSTCVLFPDEY